MKKNFTFQKLWIYTATLLFAVFFIPQNAQAQVDLKLELISPNASPGVFGNVMITAIVTNEGSDTATGVLLEFPTFPSNLPVTGDPMETQGLFSNWWTGTATWDVGTLAAGASVNVEIGLFPLAENIDFYGEIVAAVGNDSDSTPGNGTSPNPSEDDEAAITINDTGGGNCELTALVSNILCSDNGTTMDEIDDTFEFIVAVNGQNTSGNWTADFPIPSMSSTMISGSVGSAATASFNINAVNALPSGILTFTVEDVNDANCSTLVSIVPPPTCSTGGGPCDFVPNVSNIQCFDNGTPDNPNDDNWSFDFSADNSGLNSAYLAGINGQSSFGAFNQTSSFGLFPIAAGDVTLTIGSLTGIPCGPAINIAAPAPCSNGGNGNGIDLELSMSSPTSNPSIFSNGTVIITVNNTGILSATDVEVEIPSPVGYVYQGGNEFVASQGSFNYNGTQIWTVGNIAAGAGATIEVNYFFLADPSGIANYSQVINAGQTDTDSTPDNGTCCTPNEDDEAVFTFGGAVTTPDLFVSDFTENWPTPLALGVEYPFTFNLQNIGAGTATGSYRVGVYLSEDGFLSGNDFLIGEVTTGNTTVGTITDVPGLVEVTTDVPSATYFVLLVADDLDDISETNENNNIQVSNDTYEVENNGNVCTGVFVATSQAELNQFNATCTTWAGAIELSGNITDLSPLGNLDNILGNITLDGTNVIDLSGLSNLQTAGAFFLYNNSELNTVAGLSNSLVTPAIQIINNFNLGNIGGLPISNSLTDLTIANNPNLLAFAGLDLNGAYPNLDLTLALLPNVTSLLDFQNLTQLKSLSISQMGSLTTLNNLENIVALENLSIGSNPILSDCCAIFDLLNNNGVSGTTFIGNNEMGCNSVQDVLDNCTVSNCQITATVLDIQCQSNLTLNSGSDDTYTARILVEGSNDCFGNYKIDGVLGGIFGSPAIFGQVAMAGPFPISGGDVTVVITDFNDEGAISVILNAPISCSNGVDPNECGFENTYPALPNNFLNLFNTEVSETTNGYAIESFGNTSGNATFSYFDLNIDFAGTELSNNTTDLPSGTFARAADGDFFTATDLPNNQLEITKITPTGTEVWANTFTFDTGGPQSPANIRDVIELPDGYAFLVSAFGVTYTGWILKTDEAGNETFNNPFQIQPDGFIDYYFDQLAQNGDFLIYRQSDSRVGKLIRATGSNGNLIFEESIIGDLVSNRIGGFDETPDGNFIYASYREEPFPVLEKLDAFTGERQWKIRLTDVFSPENDFTFGGRGDVVATNDGGAVVGYSMSSPVGVPPAFEYGKVNAAGNLVWSRQLPSTYGLNAKLATSDGGVLFVGNIDGEYGVIKTTSEGLLTPTCVDNGGGQCSISASAINIFCDDQGSPDNPLDDKFGFELLVTGSNTGSSWSATDNASGQMIGGQYGIATTYPDLFFIQNGASFLIEDSDDANCSTLISVTPPAPCSNGGGNGIDLELNITDAPTSISAWTNISVEYTITNNGTTPESGIRISVPLPASTQYQGGNEGSASQGIFASYGGNVWDIDDLAAGESAILTINYFVLAANDPISIYGQVEEQDGIDTDSAAGNGSCCVANEDDEAALVLTTSVSQQSIAGQYSTNVLSNRAFLIEKLYPNPTTHSFKVELVSSLETEAVLQIASVSGAVFLQKNIMIEEGQTVLEMNVTELPRGIYFLKIETERGVLVERFLKK